MTRAQTLALAALSAEGKKAITGQGGVWIKGDKWISWAGPYRCYSIIPEKRIARPKISPYGDYATIAMLNSIKP